MPSKNLFPKSCGSSVNQIPLAFSQISWGFLVPLSDTQVGKTVLGPRTFATVRELLWCNCSAVCGSSALQLYSGVNGDLIQKDLCQHPEALRKVPLTVDPCLCWRLLDTHRQVWVSLLWGHCSFLLGPGGHEVLFVPIRESVFPSPV